MAGADFRKVARGDALSIPAETYNAFVDAALSQRMRQRDLAAEGAALAIDANTVWVRNDSAADCPRFGVLGIDGPSFDPTDADELPQFKNRVALLGVAPTSAHRGKFVIAREPIPKGRYGRAAIAGLVVCKVDAAGDVTAADIAEGETGYLAGGSGVAQVLWRASGTGAQWAVVRFGGVGGGGFLGRMVECPDDTTHVGKVRKQTGNPWDGTPGAGGEEAADILVLCPPGLLTDTVHMPLCYVAPAADCTPPWVVLDLINWDPGQAATGGTEGITTGTLNPHQWQPPPEVCT